MKAELVSARFEPSNAAKGDPEAMWSEVQYAFRWPDRPEWPYMRILVRQKRDRDATYAELERRAQDQAIAVLREALAQLEAHSLADLDREPEIDWGLDEGES